MILGIILGGLPLSSSATASTIQPSDQQTVAVERAVSVVDAAATGCKDPNNWWDNLRLNAGSMKNCKTNLPRPWEAGDALCTVAENGRGVAELVNCTGATPETSGSVECWINVAT
ncbi:hypothetical protein ACFC14_18520, partial [Microbacterium sp. NPDC055988]|uniref:hypothetical protein n=1 Tax=Microbacterium sp. NPDC055988 TaxID=3345671 RepID=UPI0035DF53B9